MLVEMVLTSPVMVTVVTLVGGVIVAYMEHGRRESAKTRADVKAAKYQVENAHSTNLRDDLDVIAASGKDATEQTTALVGEVSALAKAVGGLRDDLRIERQERLQVAARLDAKLD